MGRKVSQFRRKRPLTRMRAVITEAIDLTIGPPPRDYHREDWSEREEQLRDEWEATGGSLVGTTPRPWALFWFLWPRALTRPGRRRDGLLAAGELTPDEAVLMAAHHGQHRAAERSRRGG